MIPERALRRLTQLPGARSLWRKFPFGSCALRVQYGIFDRPNYAYGVYTAADLGKRLGLKAITVIEFGVAGGGGLLALERLGRIVGEALGIQVKVAGFDTGEGMPAALDYRDVPHVWDTGFYKMDAAKLRAAMGPDTELVLGNLRDTIASWVPSAPVGFVSFDVDYYSSTCDALRLFDKGSDTRLPRVYSYFDDIMWPEHACHNEYIGELCAIREFNEQHEFKKVCPINMFRHMRIHQAPWNDQFYVMHDFHHPLYSKNIMPSGDKYNQLPL